MCVVKMEAYLDANDLWEAVEYDYEIPTLPEDPTLARMRNHKEKRLTKSKAMSVLFFFFLSVKIKYYKNENS